MTTNFFLFSKNGHHNQFLTGERFYDQTPELQNNVSYITNLCIKNPETEKLFDVNFVKSH